MPELRNYHLFISHSWTYSDAYEKLVNLLDRADYFLWSDYSVPQDDPIHNAPTTEKLRKAIRAKVEKASCVLILAGVYSTYSKWINIEIEIAKELGKPIIAIEPWGAEKTSKVVKDNADEIVSWNTASVVDAIRDLAI